jgi:Reverse transcriptase (RNA-dependent DNA polymerase)
LLQLKKLYYSNITNSCSDCPRHLWSTVNSLLRRTNAHPLPNSSSFPSLANSFASFFSENIEKLRLAFSTNHSSPSDRHFPGPSLTPAAFSSFRPAIEIQKLILDSRNKKSQLDPFPTWLQCLPVLLSVITKIVNLSLYWFISFFLQALCRHLAFPYPSSGSFLVSCNKFKSTLLNLSRGVPQGSVLGPILFILYTTALSTFISSLSINHQLYADDTQLFMSFFPSDFTSFIDSLRLAHKYIKYLTGCQLIYSLSNLPKLNSFFFASLSNSLNLTVLFLTSLLKPLFTHPKPHVILASSSTSPYLL